VGAVSETLLAIWITPSLLPSRMTGVARTKAFEKENESLLSSWECTAKIKYTVQSACYAFN